MIHWYPGRDIFELEGVVDVLVNPVNCRGVMGAGLARKFRDRNGLECFENYVWNCARAEMRPGDVILSYPESGVVANLATKNHWLHNSHIEWIVLGLFRLRDMLESENFESVAIPKLGCGLGGLSWDRVAPMIDRVFEDVEVEVLVLGEKL